MIYVLIVLVVLITIIKKVYCKYTKKQVLEMSNDENLDIIINKLPDNLTVCNELLQSLNKQDVKVSLNENKKTNDSFYNIFNNKILLCNNEKSNKSFTRLLFISHECWHANQDKKFLWINFILANINLIYLVVSIILIVLNKLLIEQYTIVLSIYLALNIFVYFARNMIETDATYMSLILSSDYLDRYLDKNEKEKVFGRYKEIISKGTSTFIYNIFMVNYAFVYILLFAMLIKLYILGSIF